MLGPVDGIPDMRIWRFPNRHFIESLHDRQWGAGDADADNRGKLGTDARGVRNCNASQGRAEGRQSPVVPRILGSSFIISVPVAH